MLYLLLTIALSSTFSLMMKHAHSRRYGVLAVGCLNYIAAGFCGVVWAAAVQSGPPPVGALAFGSVGGLMYVLCYISIMALLDRQGISIATAVTRLAIAVPIVASVVLWSERPTGLQTVGLGLTVLAILAFEFRDRGAADRSVWAHWWPLAGCFATAGLARLSMKAFTQLYGREQVQAYIGAWFAAAALVSLGLMMLRGIRPRGREWPFGIALGLVNVSTLFFTLLALRQVPAIVFFPVTAVGSLVVVVGLAAAVWRERLDRRTWWGMVLASAALVMVNLK